jgi:phospholipid/cholesterol/gamma-HCH transport system substrate-binding protein
MYAKKNIAEIITGAAVLLTTLIFGIIIYRNNNLNSKDSYCITASFNDISGISVGSDVKVSGVKVGTVKSLEIVDGYIVKTTITVNDNKLKIPRDSSLSIATDGIVGQKFISITPGVSEEYLKNMENIEDTRSSVNIEQLLNKFLFSKRSSKDK